MGNEQAKTAAPAHTPNDVDDAAILRYAKKLGVDQDKYHFAIIGASGVGKSSLINAIFGIQTAAVGNTETTSKPKYYTSDDWSHVKIWDVPGYGTPKHRVENYFMENCLFLFESLIIVVGRGIGEYDVIFAKLAKKYGRNCVFVRSMADSDMENESLDHFRVPFTNLSHEHQNQVSQNVYRKVKDDFKVQAKENNVEEFPFYYITSRDWKARSNLRKELKFDEEKLIASIMKHAIDTRGIEGMPDGPM